MNKAFYIYFLLLVILAGCKHKEKAFVTGTITGAKGYSLYLDELGVSSYTALDSATLKGKGRFKFRVELDEPAFLQLRLSNNKIIPLIANPGERISIETTEPHFSIDYTIEGSIESAKLKSINEEYRDARSKLDSIKVLARQNIDDTFLAKLNLDYDSIQKSHKKEMIGFLLDNSRSLASIVVLYQKVDSTNYFFNSLRDMQYFKIISDTLNKYFPRVKQVMALSNDTRRMLDNYAKYRLLTSTKVVESSLPNIRLPNVKGDTVSLSSLKGKMVLVSFWTSSNRDCVRQNIELKKIYQQYHPRGFEIYQVSIDMKKEDWIRAIRFDELPWINVHDKEAFKSRALQVYNVQKLPFNYLLDANQEEILGKDLSPRELKIKLSRLLNS